MQRQLEHVAGEWVGGFISTSRGQMPDALAWIELPLQLIVRVRPVAMRDTFAAAAGELLAATREPDFASPRRPRRVRVASAELARALEGCCEDIEIVVAPTPELAIVEAKLIAGEPHETYFGEGVTSADISCMFQAAAWLYRLQPARSITTRIALAMSCDVLGIDAGMLAITPASTFEVRMLRWRTDFSVLLESELRHRRGEPARWPASLSCGFTSAAEYPCLAAEARAHGWVTAAPDGFPFVIAFDRMPQFRPLARRELVGLTAVLHGLARYLAGDGTRVAIGDGEEVGHGEWTVETTLGDVIVGLGTPPSTPRGTPFWIDVRDATLEHLPDESAQDRYREALLYLFAHSSDASPDDVHWAEMLIRIALFRGIGAVTALTPRRLDRLISDDFPAVNSPPPSHAPAIVQAARKLLAFAATELGSKTASAALAALRPSVEDRLARKLATIHDDIARARRRRGA